MADTSGEGYLSIGEVLGLLLEEFPDVTISKIRFLESQGLISPERTPSGYRKFYDDDVELLRVILTEQRENFLPLRVIKNRLETGEIDPTGEHLRPDDDQLPPDPDAASPSHDSSSDADEYADPDPTPAEVPASAVSSHPAARHQPAPEPTRAEPAADVVEHDDAAADAPEADDDANEPAPAQLLPGVLLDRTELCAMIGMTDAELEQLESFGIVQRQEGAGGVAVYGDDAVEIAAPACAFLRAGVDARHLRTFRTAAEREASLYEQLVTPRFRQRNPEARAEALSQLRQLDALGSKLRSALTKHALSHHFRP
ncbi:MerR-like DNA binding protein [Ilumatobacter fluminis]|uniref:MerR-like DNA binding protein n=1 Tax=Ilumatobacter fluminis TaxID=467091 RepID=A0A4R7I1J5_9ACTN|nr:MerR family transcriptional regulator [Ilumatobacter fluminis]TDT16466.1 MerR-like DNA binding protein [Ilumatobacter fluminis]